MQIALVNGSPKYKNSASELLLQDLEGCLEKYSDNNITYFSFQKTYLKQDELELLLKQDIIVFSFPLYVDGIPSHLLNCLVEIEQYLQKKVIKDRNIYIYSITNCGFFEGNQNRLATQMMKHWSLKSHLKWGQGLSVGAGGMLTGLKNVPLGAGPKKNLGKAFDKFANNISECKSEDTICINANFPRFAYKLAAEAGWRKSIKSNGLKRKDLFHQCD